MKIANGKTEKAILTLNLPITIGSTTFFHTTHVFENLPVPLLLGDDFLPKNQDTLIYNGSTAELTLLDNTKNNLHDIETHHPIVEKYLPVHNINVPKLIAK